METGGEVCGEGKECIRGGGELELKTKTVLLKVVDTLYYIFILQVLKGGYRVVDTLYYIFILLVLKGGYRVVDTLYYIFILQVLKGGYRVVDTLYYIFILK